MARAAIFLDDLWADALNAHSGQATGLPASNVARPLPGEAYEQAEAQDGGASSWEVSPRTAYKIRVDEGLGGGTIAVSLPYEWHSSVGALTTAIETALNGSAFLTLTYSCGYSTATRKFTISAASSFTLVNSSTTDNLLTQVLGWPASDSGPTTIHQSTSRRSSTITHLRWDTTTGIAPNLIGLMLESVSGDDDPEYDSCKVYASNTNHGRLWHDWHASAALALAVSARPAEAENTLQAAVTSNATTYRFWFLVWPHADDATYHRVRIARACKALSSSTRTVREVTDHQLAQRTTPISLEEQHPTRLLSEYRMTVEFDRWPAADYRAVKVKADRYGQHDGAFLALRWTDVLSGALSVADEADAGLMFYGSVRSSSTDRYAGSGSDYMSGSLTLGQLR